MAPMRIIFDLPGRRIHQSHNLDPQSGIGPFPSGEGPSDYVECVHRCDNLNTECAASDE
jgi:hypothetical protein